MSPSSSSKRVNKVPVVIVGGGLSGLSAAARLTELEVRFLLLEAQPRLGGRVRTVRHKLLVTDADSDDEREVTLDLGATWFHGTHGNAAYDIAVKAGLVERTEDAGDVEEDADGAMWLCSTKGRLVRLDGSVEDLETDLPMEIARRYANVWQEMTRGDSGRDEGVIGKNVSVESFVREKIGWERMDGVERGILRMLEHFESCVDGCNSLGEESASACGEYKTVDGGNENAPKGGMSAVVDALAQLCEKGGDVQVGRIVRGVEWDKNGVIVSIEGHGFVEADCVIWTAGLNVTKKAIENGVFRPDVGFEKVEALGRRGMGAVEKVFAFVDEVGMLEEVAEDGHTVPVYWEQDDIGCGDGSFDHKAVNEEVGTTQWMEGVYGVTYIAKLRCVCIWLHGGWSATFCALDPVVARKEVMALLSRVYRREVVVREILRSGWGEGQFTRGSYSFPAIGAREGDVEVISKALKCGDYVRVCFAGEATHERFYSTMHGAVESGRREAERVVASLMKGQVGDRVKSW